MSCHTTPCLLFEGPWFSFWQQHSAHLLYLLLLMKWTCTSSLFETNRWSIENTSSMQSLWGTHSTKPYDNFHSTKPLSYESSSGLHMCMTSWHHHSANHLATQVNVAHQMSMRHSLYWVEGGGDKYCSNIISYHTGSKIWF